MSEKTFAEGIYFNDKHEKAPDFVIGSISIQYDKFIDWIAKQESNEKGYIKLDIVRSKAGKPYITLNTYKAQQKENVEEYQPKKDILDDMDDIEIPDAKEIIDEKNESVRIEDVPF